MAGSIDRVSGDLPVRGAATVAATIPSDASVAVSGFGSVGYPKAIPLELASQDRDLDLTIVSGGSVGAEIDSTLASSGAISRRHPYVAREEIRGQVNDGRVAFTDRHISRVSDDVAFGGLPGPDVAIVEAVAVGPDWLIPSTSVGHTPAFVQAAGELVVEVNAAQPLAVRKFHDVYRPQDPPNRKAVPLDTAGQRIGSPRIRFPAEKLTAVVMTDRPDSPYTFRDPSAEDLAIGANLSAFLQAEIDRNPVFEESVHFQFGVGGLGNAVTNSIQDVEFGERDVAYFGEVIQDALLPLIDDGSLSVASGTSLALSRDGQQRLFRDIDTYAEDIVVRPADISNRPGLIDRFGVISVNSALEVDVYGNANVTHLDGSRLVNGIGGGSDYTRHALLGVVALPSTAAGGDISRIVPMTPHVDHSEHDVSVVVTEQGLADLRGLAPGERAEAIVSRCAHPEFRTELREYLDRAREGGGHIPHDLDTALSWHGEEGADST